MKVFTSTKEIYPYIFIEEQGEEDPDFIHNFSIELTNEEYERVVRVNKEMEEVEAMLEKKRHDLYLENQYKNGWLKRAS